MFKTGDNLILKDETNLKVDIGVLVINKTKEDYLIINPRTKGVHKIEKAILEQLCIKI